MPLVTIRVGTVACQPSDAPSYRREEGFQPTRRPEPQVYYSDVLDKITA